MTQINKSAKKPRIISKKIISSLVPTKLIAKLSEKERTEIAVKPNNDRLLKSYTNFNGISTPKIKEVLTIVNKILKEADNDSGYPIVVVAGDTPNYNDRLPYNVCETHETESGISITKYEPRAWEFNQDNSITLFDGANETNQESEAEVEFEVSIESEDIIGMWAQNPK